MLLIDPHVGRSPWENSRGGGWSEQLGTYSFQLRPQVEADAA